MSVDRIEAILGSASIDDMQTALEKALLRSRRSPNGLEALVDLLLAQVASVIDFGADDQTRLERAEHCANKLVALVEAMAKIRALGDDVELNNTVARSRSPDPVTRLQ